MGEAFAADGSGVARLRREAQLLASLNDPHVASIYGLEEADGALALGTAAYMSPEQARGSPVDKRADIWVFGVVLFERLSGRRLFPGETLSDTLAAVLTREPQRFRSVEEMEAAPPLYSGDLSCAV